MKTMKWLFRYLESNRVKKLREVSTPTLQVLKHTNNGVETFAYLYAPLTPASGCSRLWTDVWPQYSDTGMLS